MVPSPSPERVLPLVRILLVPALWAVLCLGIVVELAGYAPDDMYITYRYAWNLAHGEGLVFNPGERVFGLTNPGHALGLALLHGVTRVPVHVLGGAVYALSLWAMATLLWLELRRRGAALEAVVGGTLVLGASYLWASAGSASASVLALLAGSALLALRRPATSGVLAGLAVWYRPDAVLGVAVLGLLVWLERRRPPWRWGLVAGGVILAGVVAAWLWFGSPLPNTLEAKRIMAEARPDPWAGPERFWARAAPLFGRHLGSGWLLLVGLGLAGQWPLFARGGRAVRTLVFYGGAVAVAYPLLGVPYFTWYTVPPVAVTLLGVGALAAGAGRALSDALLRQTSLTGEAAGPGRRWAGRNGLRHALPRTAGAAATALLLAVPGIPFARASYERFGALGGNSRYETYREAALWIRANSLPEERIAYSEIGILAYWSRRPVHDLMGLVTPEALPFVAAGDPVGAFLLRPPELLLLHPRNAIAGIRHVPWFQEAYDPVARFPAAREPADTVLFRKRPDAELPPPRPPTASRPSA